jgi:hypothetical protein
LTLLILKALIFTSSVDPLFSYNCQDSLTNPDSAPSTSFSQKVVNYDVNYDVNYEVTDSKVKKLTQERYTNSTTGITP